MVIEVYIFRNSIGVLQYADGSHFILSWLDRVAT